MSPSAPTAAHPLHLPSFPSSRTPHAEGASTGTCGMGTTGITAPGKALCSPHLGSSTRARLAATPSTSQGCAPPAPPGSGHCSAAACRARPGPSAGRGTASTSPSRARLPSSGHCSRSPALRQGGGGPRPRWQRAELSAPGSRGQPHQAAAWRPAGLASSTQGLPQPCHPSQQSPRSQRLCCKAWHACPAPNTPAQKLFRQHRGSVPAFQAGMFKSVPLHTADLSGMDRNSCWSRQPWCHKHPPTAAAATSCMSCSECSMIHAIVPVGED